MNVIWAIKQLMQNGAILEYVNEKGNNAAMIAACNGHSIILRHLLNTYRFKLDLQNVFGYNLAMLALMNKRIDRNLLLTLFKRGATFLNQTDKRGANVDIYVMNFGNDLLLSRCISSNVTY